MSNLPDYVNIFGAGHSQGLCCQIHPIARILEELVCDECLLNLIKKYGVAEFAEAFYEMRKHQQLWYQQQQNYQGYSQQQGQSNFFGGLLGF